MLSIVIVANTIWYSYVMTAELRGLRDNLPILRSTTGKGKGVPHHYIDSTPPCPGNILEKICLTMILFLCGLNFLLLFRERVCPPKHETGKQNTGFENHTAVSVATTLESPPRFPQSVGSGYGTMDASTTQSGPSKGNYSPNSLLKSASISSSKCVGVNGTNDSEVNTVYSFILNL